MTNLEKLTRQAIRDWCEEQGLSPVGRLRHVFPRAYVLGKAASQCLLVATPLVDAEPQCRGVM